MFNKIKNFFVLRRTNQALSMFTQSVNKLEKANKQANELSESHTTTISRLESEKKGLKKRLKEIKKL